jgi:predicted RNase H-like HicB family nuclease
MIMAQRLELVVEIEPLAEGGYLALCPDIPGCHAEGKTVGEALDHLRDVVQVIYELCQEQGLVFVPAHPEATLNDIVWKVNIPLAEAA